MCRLLYPMQSGSKAAFSLRSHPPVALEVVARLEDLSSGAPRSWVKIKGMRLRYAGGMVSEQVHGEETIPPGVADE